MADWATVKLRAEGSCGEIHILPGASPHFSVDTLKSNDRETAAGQPGANSNRREKRRQLQVGPVTPTGKPGIRGVILLEKPHCW